ncbi:hypothetical protein [Streptomyces tremellae]|uniref:hypothetical protein n=1 Tax=Streptomyces tremellae TaxID=1124239 RepID=UPI0031EDC274
MRRREGAGLTPGSRTGSPTAHTLGQNVHLRLGSTGGNGSTGSAPQALSGGVLAAAGAGGTTPLAGLAPAAAVSCGAFVRAVRRHAAHRVT